jgi:antitoxin (DNA-binding transcriptional repressor) of toxin-antitoxin stability system
MTRPQKDTSNTTWISIHVISSGDLNDHYSWRGWRSCHRLVSRMQLVCHRASSIADRQCVLTCFSTATSTYDFSAMRIKLYDVTQDLAQAISEVKAGNHVVIMEDGTPVAMIEALRPASEEEEDAIRDMIASGFLRTNQKAGVRVWKAA